MKTTLKHHSYTPIIKYLLIAILLAAGSALSSNEVRMVIELSSEGARTPYFNFSKFRKDRNFVKKLNSSRPDTQSTPVGIRQHLLAGENLRFRFPKIFKNGLNNQNHYTRAKNGPSFLTSAYAHTFGANVHQFDPTNKLPFANNDTRNFPGQDLLFDPSKEFNFSTAMLYGLQPVTVHSESYNQDFLLNSMNKACPKNQVLKVSTWKNLEKEVQSSEYLKETVELGLKAYNITHWPGKRNFTLCYFLADFVLQEWYNNPQAPLKPGDAIFERLMDCYSLGDILALESPQVLKTAQSALIGKVIEYFQRKVGAGSTIEEDQLSARPLKADYSLLLSNSEIITPTLLKLGLLDIECLKKRITSGSAKNCTRSPLPASNLVFELIEITSSEESADQDPYGVRVTYNEEPLNYCNQTDPKSSEFICPLSKFNKIYNDEIRVCNLEFYCVLSEVASKAVRNFYLIVGLVTLLVILNIMVIFKIFSLKKSIRKGFESYRMRKTISFQTKSVVVAGDECSGNLMGNQKGGIGSIGNNYYSETEYDVEIE